MARTQVTISGKQAFSRHLKELMEENKDTQSDLAAAIDVQRQSISYYLSGDRNPGADVIKRLAEKYDVSADWLLGLSKDRKRENRKADDLGIADTTAHFIQGLDVFVKEDIDDLVLHYSEEITGLLEELSFVLALVSDIQDGRYNSDEYYAELKHSKCLENYPYELLSGENLLFYKMSLLESQFSDFLRAVVAELQKKKGN